MKVDLNAGGEISDRKIGTTPIALQNQQSVRNVPRERLCNLPLNTELNAESAGGELAECIRNDPERDEHSGEEDRDTRGEKIVTLGVVLNAFSLWILT